MKILINGSPWRRFEHSGVLPGAKLHARHDGHSEIISLQRSKLKNYDFEIYL